MHEPPALHLHAESFPELIDLLAENKAGEEAFRFFGSGRTLTYAQLAGKSRALAARLSRSCSEGDRVLLLFPDAEDFIPAFFACLAARLVAVPAAMPLREEGAAFDRLRGIIADSSPAAAVTSQKGSVLLSSIGESAFLPCFTLEPPADACGADTGARVETVDTDTASDWIARTVDPTDLAFLQYTSGSTSRPKGVMITHGNLWANSRAIFHAFGHSEKSRGVIWLPHFHDMGLIGGLLQPVFGAFPTLLMTPAEFIRRPVSWLKNISEFGGSTSGGPNFAYELCLSRIGDAELATLDLSSWRVAFCGAEPIRHNTLRRFATKFGPSGFSASSFLPCFGMAETTLMLTGSTLGQEYDVARIGRDALNEQGVASSDVREGESVLDIVSCGRPVPDHEAMIVCLDSGLPCQPGKIGEIFAAGPSVAAGYWNDPVATAEHFGLRIQGLEKAYLRTGDVGFARGSQVFVTGRRKELIIVNGCKYHPVDIEEAIYGAVSGLPHGSSMVFGVSTDTGEAVVAVVEFDRKKRDVDLDAMFDSISQAIHREFAISLHELILVDRKHLPRTTSGKLRREPCKRLYETGELTISARRGRRPERAAKQALAAARPSVVASSADQRAVADILAELLNGVLTEPLDETDRDREFHKLGLDSVQGLSLIAELENRLERPLSPSMIYDHPSINRLAAAIAGSSASADHSKGFHPSAGGGEIAIIGIGCRVPGAAGVGALWTMLSEGPAAAPREAALRWRDGNAVGMPPGYFVDDVEYFDPEFFGISPREAHFIDPQHRLLLEIAQEAFEDAGIAEPVLRGSRTGVFIGISGNDYALAMADDLSAYSGLGNAHSIAANRLSYIYDLKGPSLSVDTACSSSLAAVDQAVQSLIRGRSDIALAGGVNLMLTPHLHRVFGAAGMLSPDGRCHTYDRKANGYARGEGCGLIVLKRLDDALRDGDRIYARIVGCALNQDGRSNGITAPNGPAQVSVIAEALGAAGVSVNDVGYVEGHGTGTSLGDLIEFQALEAAFAGRVGTRLPIGSIKTNIGHLEAAAGIMGLIKASLVLHHRRLVPHHNLDELNPHIAAIQRRVEVNTRAQPWPQDRPLVAGVSSFGFGGTNVHVVVRGHQQETQTEPVRSYNGIPVSAHCPEALAAELDTLETALASVSEERFTEVARSFACLRHPRREHRAYIHGDSAAAIRSAAADHRTSVRTPGRAPKIVFMFPGQGSHRPDMGRALYKELPGFRRQFDQCREALRSFSEIDLRACNDQAWNDAPVACQLTTFALGYAAAASLQELGVQPQAVIGHSLGEYAAATLSGALSLENALRIVHKRATLIDGLPRRGRMAAIFAPDTAIRALLDARYSGVEIAAYNCNSANTIAGSAEEVEALISEMRDKGIRARLLDTPNAFHSAFVEPIDARFAEYLDETIKEAIPAIPMISNLDGDYCRTIDASYWRRQLRQPVLFANGIRRLDEDGADLFVDLSPDGSLAGFVAAELGDAQRTVAALRGKNELRSFHAALGRFWEAGIGIEWRDFYLVQGRGESAVPPRAYQKRRFWMQQVREATAEPADKPLLEEQARVSVEKEIRSIVAALLESNATELDDHQPFLEMGADSLVLMEAISRIDDRFGVRIAVKDLFGPLNTLSAVIHHVSQHQRMPSIKTGHGSGAAREPARHSPGEPPSLAPGQSEQPAGFHLSALEIMAGQMALLNRQMALMEQLTKPENFRPAGPDCSYQEPGRTDGGNDDLSESGQHVPAFQPTPPPHDAWLRRDLSSPSGSGAKERHLSELTAALNAKTPSSKRLAERYRSVLADNRNAAGFRLATKEILYPLVGKSASGSKIRDVDGNEFVDFTMGFGTNLFGHDPAFVKDALEQQLSGGIQIGPQSELAGEVAELIAELTGVERVAFCNSGSEAVMTAIRLARAVTGRNRVAIFSNSYHGVFDGVLGRAQAGRSATGVAPIARGTTKGMVEDLLVLDYGQEEALQTIAACGDDLAAIVVEPVQSRHPDLQPKAFLQELRRIADARGLALIFDEVITGFRLAAGGAQAYFEVRADIVTYGKIVGGGLPIGVVAGSSRFLDPIDGGAWRYGDASFPQTDPIFFAGTFSKHPLAMAASRAMLKEIRARGDALYRRLEQRTAALAEELNFFFAATGTSIRIVHAGSLFRFKYSGNYDLLFSHLLLEGFYVWEGRNCFLCDAHTEADIEGLIAAVKKAVRALHAAGYSGAEGLTIDPCYEPTDPQIRFLRPADEECGWTAGNIGCHVIFPGRVDVNALGRAWQSLIERHDVFAFAPDATGVWQRLDEGAAPLEIVTEADSAARSGAESLLSASFPRSGAPLIRAHYWEEDCSAHLGIVSHHSVTDGWSYAVLLRELSQLYEAAASGEHCSLEAAPSYKTYVDHSAAEDVARAIEAWQAKVADYPALRRILPTHAGAAGCHGARVSLDLDASTLVPAIRRHAREAKLSKFLLLYVLFDVVLRTRWDHPQLAVAVSIADREFAGAEALVGQCVRLAPLLSRRALTAGFGDLLADAVEQLLFARANKALPVGFLRGEAPLVPVAALFNLDPPIGPLDSIGAKLETLPPTEVEFPLMMNILEAPGELRLELDYQNRFFSGLEAERLLADYASLIERTFTGSYDSDAPLTLAAREDRSEVMVQVAQ